jgi:DNA ligase (NAD+)
MQIIKIKSINKRNNTSKKYDITVNKFHNFFANGLLVHNCNGEEILRNAIKMQNIPSTIKETKKIIVRGEILLTKESFDKLPSEAEFKNLRNAAAGIAKRLDGKYSEFLTFIPYNIMNTKELNIKTQLDLINTLKILGFKRNINTFIVTGNCYNEIEKIYTNYINTLRKNLDYDIDGLVIKCNDIDENDDWKKPNYQIAFKFPHQSATSNIIKIQNSMNGGHITPVAIINPVDVAGVTISRVSLSNYQLCVDRKIGVGAKVEVSRRNDVIPYIETVLVEGAKIEIPTKCPICSSDLEYESDDSVYLVCTNEGCKSKLVRSILKWLFAHNSKGISDSTIESLIDCNIISNFEEFLTLAKSSGSARRDKVLTLDGFGEKKLQVLLASISDTYKTNWSTFLSGINIHYIGKTVIEKILESIGKVEKYDDFYKFCFSQNIYSVENFANENVIRLRKGLNAVKNKVEILLKYVEVEPFVSDKADLSKQFLRDYSFCFTGSLDTIGRTEAEKMVKKFGGDIKGVSKNLSFLVTNDTSSGSSKNVKARQLGVKVINEKTFLSYFDKKSVI